MAWRPWFQQGATVAYGHIKRMQKPIKRWDVIRGDWVGQAALKQVSTIMTGSNHDR